MSTFIKIMKDVKQHVMSGVAYMIPFVVAGGIILAASVLLGGENATPTEGALGQIASVGSAGLGLMVPILAGFISYSIADRPGLAPGMIGGFIANQIGSGFIGGMVAGIIGGIVVAYLLKIKVPESISAIMPILVIPLFGTVITCCIMLFVVGAPLAGLMVLMTDWLNAMSEGSSAVLAAIMGSMLCFDMGGMVNKVAATFAQTLVGTIDPATGMPAVMSMQIMAVAGAAWATPPIACFVATFVFRKKYSASERNSGIAALFMGLCGISEGAIPFVASDLLRVVPSCMVGGIVTAVMAMMFGCTNPAPWGGVIVAPTCGNPIMYVVAIFVGSIVGGLVMGALHKSTADEAEAAAAAEEDVDDLDLDLAF